MINLNEKFIAELLEAKIQESDGGFCICENCVTDIMVLALNRLPPRYVADRNTAMFFKPNEFADDNIIQQTNQLLDEAIGTVSENPRHKLTT
jgi:Late competence development protein ComFB